MYFIKRSNSKLLKQWLLLFYSKHRLLENTFYNVSSFSIQLAVIDKKLTYSVPDLMYMV